MDGKANCLLFADDTSLINSDHNLNILKDKAESALQSVKFASNSLSLNKTKTQQIIFSSNDQHQYETSVKTIRYNYR